MKFLSLFIIVAAALIALVLHAKRRQAGPQGPAATRAKARAGPT